MNNVHSAENQFSRETAYQMACESAVILKNYGVLSLKGGRRDKIMTLGPNADRIPCGGGSGKVDPLFSISLYEGLSSFGKKWPVTLLKPFKGLDYNTSENVKALKETSTVIVSDGFGTKTEKENHDRTFTLPEGQDEMIRFAASLNPNVIVVVYAGERFDMAKWKDSVMGIILGWYPGQEGGLVLARIMAVRPFRTSQDRPRNSKAIPEMSRTIRATVSISEAGILPGSTSVPMMSQRMRREYSWRG